MIEFIYRGLGMIVIIYGILAALLMNIITIKLFGDSYYQEHAWPKLAVLLLAGTACLVTGLFAKKVRRRYAEQEREYIDSLSRKGETLKQIAFSGPRDHLMFIPVHYWSLIYYLAAILYAVKVMR